VESLDLLSCQNPRLRGTMIPLSSAGVPSYLLIRIAQERLWPSGPRVYRGPSLSQRHGGLDVMGGWHLLVPTQ
jgi:hypothetical protein